MARRLIVFFAAMTGIAMAAGWLADRPGRVVVDWQSYRVETSFAAVVLIAVIAAIAVFLLLRFVRWLVRGQALGAERRLRRAHQRGEKALARGLTALAAGDAAQARKHAERAEAYLKHSPFVILLQAQAARLDGDTRKAAGFYRKLAGQPETDLLGLRGLMNQALEAGDEDAALKLASRAVSVRPRTGWALNALFDMSLARSDWRAAERAVDGALKAGMLPPAEAARRRGAVALLEARDKARAGDWRGAGKLARASHATCPDLVPAVTLAAQAWLRGKNPRRARHFIENAWARAPHPDVARLYRDAVADRPLAEQVSLLQAMTAGAPDHIESRLAVAETALDAALWGMAREAVAPLTDHPTPRSARAMAAVAAGEGDEEAEREWLTRASDAPYPDARWTCRHCGFEPPEWEAACDRCGSFDTVAWNTPRTVSETGTVDARGWRQLIEPDLIG